MADDTPPIATRAQLQALNVRLLLSPILPFLDDASVSEVLINGHAEIRIERRGRLSRAEAQFEDEEELRAALLAVAQYNDTDLGDGPVTFDGRLPDGSRVHAVFPPASRQGICVAIRKSKPTTLTIDNLIESGSLTPEAADFLRVAVTLQKNILISGGTSSGKTTVLAVIGSFIPDHERVLVLEDVHEILLPKEHVLYMEGATGADGRRPVTIRDLFRSSLRMRPDRIIVGECRGGEALDMIQAMTSGHSGSMTTLHASTPMDAVKRLETMCLMSGIELPLSAIRSQIASAVDIIVQVARVRSGARRVLTIAEARGLGDAGEYRMFDLFRVDPAAPPEHAPLQWTGEVSAFAQEAVQHGDAGGTSPGGVFAIGG